MSINLIFIFKLDWEYPAAYQRDDYTATIKVCIIKAF